MAKNNKPVFAYIAAALSMFVPAPGRLAYGLVLILEIIFLTFFGVLLQSITKKLSAEDFSKPLSFVFLFFLVLIFQQILNILCPFITITLGFNIYLVALSAVPVVFFTSNYIFSQKLSFRLKYTMKHCMIFSFLGFLFFLFRDIFAFGTITLPGRHKLLEIILIPALYEYNSFFFNSIPFALILLSILLAFVSLILRKFEIVRRSL